MKQLLINLFLCLSVLTYAESVRLYNDSPWKLDVQIYAADGTPIGQMTINPYNLSTWSDNYSSFGSDDSPYSQTPYVVYWLCPDGTPFSACSNVATGSTVTPSGCFGNRICPPPKKPTPPPLPAQ